MEYAIGGLVVIILVLVVCLVQIWHKLILHITDLKRVIEEKPQNIIHLGIKDVRLTTGITPTNLSIRQEDFRLNADKVYKNLVAGYTKRANYDLGIRAYCIIKDAGLREILDHTSASETEKALTRLLSNEDEEAVMRFLRTVAESVSVELRPEA